MGSLARRAERREKFQPTEISTGEKMKRIRTQDKLVLKSSLFVLGGFEGLVYWSCQQRSNLLCYIPKLLEVPLQILHWHKKNGSSISYVSGRRSPADIVLCT